ncbi:MAG: hypothetical protein ACYSSO_13010 [Planctomycetota bacterium]|jgi:hypothetical protein
MLQLFARYDSSDSAMNGLIFLALLVAGLLWLCIVYSREEDKRNHRTPKKYSAKAIPSKKTAVDSDVGKKFPFIIEVDDV